MRQIDQLKQAIYRARNFGYYSVQCYLDEALKKGMDLRRRLRLNKWEEENGEITKFFRALNPL